MNAKTDINVKVARAIKEIPESGWNEVYPKTAEGYRFFKAIDESGFNDFSFYYIMAYLDKKPIAAAPCFIMDYPIEMTVEGRFKNILAAVRRALPGILNLKTLICGCVAAEGRIGVAKGFEEAAVTAVVDTMKKIAGEEKISVIAFKDFSKEQTEILDLLLKDGFHKIESYPSVELEMAFSSIEEYLKTLSRATRKDLKRKFQKADSEAGMDFGVVNDLGGLLDSSHRLYMETYSKSDVQFERIPKDFLKNISKNLPVETKFFLWRIKGDLVAFDLCLVSDNVLIDEYIGLDYSLAHKYHLYFITFRDIIDWCLKNGIKKYESGALTYEPKKRLGCRFTPNFIYVRHMNRLINPLFKALARILKPENFDETLRKMKKEGNL